MRHPKKLIVVATTLFAACAAPDATAPAATASVAEANVAAARQVQLVTGHTNFVYGPGLSQTTSFNAKRDADGSVSGQVELNVHGASHDRLHGTVTCMTVNGNEAIIGGTVDESTFGAVAWAIRMVDNGEGANAAPDLWSDLMYVTNPAFDPANACAIRFQPLAPIAGGNIQVH